MNIKHSHPSSVRVMRISFLCEGDVKKKIMGQADIRRKFEQIPVGSYVWVEFTGFKETDNGAMKEYKVEFDPDMKAD